MWRRGLPEARQSGMRGLCRVLLLRLWGRRRPSSSHEAAEITVFMILHTNFPRAERKKIGRTQGTKNLKRGFSLRLPRYYLPTCPLCKQTTVLYFCSCVLYLMLCVFLFFFWLAPGELPVEAQFTEFQQGARGASLVTNNRPRWCANIEAVYIGP
jgi:hypothetical protein